MDGEKRCSTQDPEIPFGGKTSGTRIYHQGSTDAECLAEVREVYPFSRTVPTRPDQNRVFQCYCSGPKHGRLSENLPHDTLRNEMIDQPMK